MRGHAAPMNSPRSAVLVWVLGALFAPVLLSKARADATASPIEFAADVPLVMADGMPCVEVRIGGGAPVLFGIDTGDVNSVVDTGLAKAAGLKLEALDPSVPADIFKAKVAELHIGPLSFAGTTALVMDFVKYKLPPRMAGTLAYTLFKDRVLQVDFHSRRVRISAVLRAPAALPGTTDHFSLITFGRSGPPIVVARGFGINGRPVTAQVDTLYTGSLLIYSASVDKLGLGAAAKTGATEFFPFTDGGVTMKVAAADSESFHGIGFGRKLYFPTPGVHEPDSLFDATVGLGVLSDTVLTLDFHDGTLSVQGFASQDPDTASGRTASLDSDPGCAMGGNPTLMRICSSADFVVGTVIPFLFRELAGRP
jgi:aspartyl protease